MLCMKCGKETKGEQVFCDRCLESMEAYPVKRDVHVQLPNRPTAPVQKKNHRKQRSMDPEEQVVYLRAKLRRTKACALLLVFALLLSLVALLYTNRDAVEEKLGTNYTYVEQTQ